MSAVVTLRQAHSLTRAELPMLLHGDVWAAATDDARNTASLRGTLLRAAVDKGYSASLGAQWLAAKLVEGSLPTASQDAAELLLRRGEGLSEATLKRWLLNYAVQGKLALLPKHTGRVRQAYGWEAKAIELYNTPSKTTYAGVAKELRYEYGFENVSDSLVKRYIQSLPVRLGSRGIARTGPHLHRLTMQKFQERHLDNIRPGDVYVGDGHTIDCYVAHPNTGRPWRPELTFFMDLKSRLPVGWWLGNSENAVDTLRALGTAIGRFDHMPPMLYLDHGAGYRAKLMSADNVGFASQMGIDIMAAHPGNPHGKGWVECFFRRLRDEHDKFFAGGMVYCGDDMAAETNRRMSPDILSGKRRLPSFYDYKASLMRYIERFSREVLEELLDGKTPMQVWEAGFVRIPAVYPVAELIRPMQMATVRRQMVTLHKRTYFHAGLIDYQDQAVRVRYDLHDDSRVWVCDDKNKLICEAALTYKVAAIPSDRIEEARANAEAKAAQRKRNDIAEIEARNADPIDAHSQVLGLQTLLPSPPVTLPAPMVDAPAADDDFDLDLTNWRKD